MHTGTVQVGHGRYNDPNNNANGDKQMKTTNDNRRDMLAAFSKLLAASARAVENDAVALGNVSTTASDDVVTIFINDLQESTDVLQRLMTDLKELNR